MQRFNFSLELPHLLWYNLRAKHSLLSLDKWEGGLYAKPLFVRRDHKSHLISPFSFADCPQVQAVFDYQAQQPDELSLERGDVVKVYRKMADGMSLAGYSRK